MSPLPACPPDASAELLREWGVLESAEDSNGGERSRVEARLAVQNRLLELVARGTPMPDMLSAIARGIELLSPGGMASVLLLDASGRLHVGAGSSLPPAYNTAVEGLPIGPNVGSCGAAAWSKRLVVVTDIHTHPNWAPFRELMKDFTIGACWSGPILASDERVLGTLAMYYEEPRSPQPHELHLMETMAHIAAVALEKAEREREREHLLALERQARDEAEAASRMKDEFLSTVSHELRTPLTSILGWAQLLRTRALPEDKRQRAMEIIERNARAQTKLIEDMLDISRIVTGKLRLDARPLELLPVLEAALEAVRPAAEAKGVRLELQAMAGVGPLSGDGERLQQVVWNLLTNAIKFTPPGGHVVVRWTRGEGEGLLEVEDSGQGISPEFLPHVFERFRQADSSSKRSHGGLGLGLAIVRHLVEMHGGTVAAHSDGPGRGSRFRVCLPCVPRVAQLHLSEEEEHAASPPPELPTLEGLHILVVDDEQDARELVAELLEGQRARVVRAASASEALEVLGSLRPDLVVSDLGMPGDDGCDLVRRLRELEAREGGHVPAVAFSAYARREDQKRALDAGFDVHVAKPLDAQALLAVVASLVPDRSART